MKTYFKVHLTPITANEIQNLKTPTLVYFENGGWRGVLVNGVAIMTQSFNNSLLQQMVQAHNKAVLFDLVSPVSFSSKYPLPKNTITYKEGENGEWSPL